MSITKLAVLISLALLLAGCARATPTAVVPPATQPVTLETPAATDTPAQPTATLEPMAAVVNGDGITLAEYQAVLASYKAEHLAAGETLPSEDVMKQAAIDNLINELLLAQAAGQAGYTVSDGDVQAHYDRLVADLGGADKLLAWQQSIGYTDPIFRTALKRGIAGAWMRDRVVSEMPAVAEQVRARQILAYSEADANAVLQKLNAGSDFATIASIYDPVSDGDLGWFPRGYLLTPEVEEAAFALQPGQRSEIIKSSAGYHIIEVLERDPQRALSTDARLKLQQKHLNQWLADWRAKAQINLSLP